MRRSFLRLVVTSVLICWAAGFAVVFSYSRSHTWSEDRARADGVFYVFEQLAAAAPADRASRLAELDEHFGVAFALVTVEDVEATAGRAITPGERVHHVVSMDEEWYFLTFGDGEGALAAGPVNPSLPSGFVPIGAIVALVLVPLLAGWVALRIERQVSKVERASQKLATGELSARVDNVRGPSQELAESFNAMAARIEALIRSRDELVQAVSHELGSPLSRLRFHLELLNQDDRPSHDRVEAMARELDALDELVAELLSYVQSDDLELDRCEFDPRQSLADLAELARLEASGERSVNVQLEVPGGLEVCADRRLFQRAVENILRNSVQHAEAEVRVELGREGDFLCVAVHDDGPGIPEELRDKVTTPFYRVEADRNRRSGGVGLGLAIVSRIMQRHAGRLEINPSPLGGAMVATLWPLSVEQTA